jgi:hypothetical protein
MDDKEKTRWRRNYQTFIRLYRGRHDIIAEQNEEGEYQAVPGEGLTFERFLDHVFLRKTYAIYNLDDSKRVSFGLFDADVFPRKQEWPKMRLGIEKKREETFRIMNLLVGMGLKRENILLEFPTVGFHLLIFFKDPAPAKDLKYLMKTVLEKLQLTEMPFYPRKTEEVSYGDRVQLPLRVNRNTSRRSNFIRDLEAFDPDHYETDPDFSVLEEVEPIDTAWLYRWVRENR